jgi:drug/metabolite transporter (DMT)-like permease
MMAPCPLARPYETVHHIAVNRHLGSRLALIGAAVLFSTGGAGIKATALDGWQVACFRAGIAAVVVMAGLPAARRGWNRRTLAVAAAYAATVILFVQANKLTTAASTTFIQSASPLFIALLGPWLIHERLRLRDAPVMAALIAGLACFFLDPTGAHRTAPDPRLGNILAGFSSFTVALMMMGLRWLGRGRDDGAPAAVALGNLIAFVVALPFSLPVHARALDLLVLGYLGVFQIGLAYALLLGAMRHMSALEASLLLFVEPVLNPVWAWLLHGERPGPWTLAGGAIILAATAIKTLRDARPEVPLPAD